MLLEMSSHDLCISQCTLGVYFTDSDTGIYSKGVRDMRTLRGLELRWRLIKLLKKVLFFAKALLNCIELQQRNLALSFPYNVQ